MSHCTVKTQLRRRLPFLLTLLLCVVASPARAEDLRIVTLKLGACGRMVDGRPGGFCYELGNALAREAGFEPVNRLVPLARGTDEVATGRADMIIMTTVKDLEGKVEDIGSIRSVTMVAWARAGTALRDKRDLGGKTVAFVRGSKHDIAWARDLNFIPIPCKNHEISLKLLMVGRAQVAVGPLKGLTMAMQELGFHRRYFGEPLVLERSSMRVYVSLRLPQEARDRLRASLVRLHENGTVARMLADAPL